jgi:UDP-N-acetylmuramate--alanine ligase
MVLNAAAALALADRLVIDHYGNRPEGTQDGFRRGLTGFTGCRRRSEVLGEAGGILFIDDYGHHPTEIVATLAGYRDFYPRRRIVVDFMSHTYSRTEKLLDGFAGAFGSADVVILHKIYSSARELKGRVDGRRLFDEVSKHHDKVVYFHEVLEAEEYCKQHLQPGDVFITLGAGNNWVLGHRLLKHFGKGDQDR